MNPESLALLIQQKLRPGLLVHLQPVFLLIQMGIFWKLASGTGFPIRFFLLGAGGISLGIALFLVVWTFKMHGWSREISVLMQEKAFDTIGQRYARFAFSRRELEHYGLEVS